jgi:transcription elongation GreA/GreB family factor
MPSPEASLPEDVAALVDAKKFEELEDLWTARMESDPGDLSFFFTLAAAVKKKGGGTQAVSWLHFLADYEGETTDADARLKVLLEIARMSPTDPEVRSDLEKELKSRYAGHPALAAVLQQNPIAGAADPGAAADRIRRWLGYVPGDVYAMPGRGAGRIVELNPALDVIRLDLGGTRVPFSLVSAERTLTRLPEGHFLRLKVEDLASIRALADRDPAETVRRMLESFGRAMTVAEVKDNLAGIVDDARWSAFWAAARKNPRLLVSGGGKTASARWTESAGASEDAVRAEFDQADPVHKLELARKQAKRSKELASWMAGRLAEEARAAAPRQSALAWELSRAGAKLGAPETFPASALLEVPDLPSVLTGIRDQAARGEALEAARASRADWYDLFAAHFLAEEDSRVLSLVYDRLAEIPERRDEIVRRVLRSPRQAPRAFLWLADRLGLEAARIAPSLFTILLDALRQDEFSSVRSKLKEFFDPGRLAVELARGAVSEEQAREYLAALERAGGLEEHRRALVKEALLMKFPELRAPAREWLYSTPEAIAARRQELTHLKSVELPANAEAMRVAKEHGDLSENFEYHAARQRHEYLSARIAALADELSRARPLDPSHVDASEVRVGTRVRLREVERGQERSVTILGPWDSKPEEAVYSYESDFAQALLGSRPGDRVTLSGVPTEVMAIEPWK